MALTIAQKLSLFQILDIPHAASFTVSDGLGATRSAEASSAVATIKSEIEDYLSDMDAGTGQFAGGVGAAMETAITDLITRWDAIGTSVARIEAGSVGEIGGVTHDYAEERQLIRERTHNLVPFMKRFEYLRKVEGERATSIPIVR